MAAEFKIGRLRYNWAGEWTPTTVYARDSVVSYQGKAYYCLVANTSSSNFYNDLYASPYAYWSLMMDGKTFVGPWTSSTLYSLGNIVTFGGNAYYCNTTHTSGVYFEINQSDWTVYTEFNGWHPAWATNKEYGINDVVVYGGIVYKCITDHVSAGSISAGLEANQADWQVYYSGIYYTGTWKANTRYRLNDLVKVNSDIYMCSTYHTSGTSFTSSDWTMWLPGQDFDLVWSATTTYQIGDMVIYGGEAYVCTSSGSINQPPPTYPGFWAIVNQGYSIQNDYMSSVTYAIGSIVRKDGMLYEATTNTYGTDPGTAIYSTTYTASGSSGTTLVVGSTNNLLPGMIVSGTGFTLGQQISSVTNSTTVVLDRGPDGTLTDGEQLTFSGVTSANWKLLVPGKFWTNRWATGTSYVVGDIAVWINGTYSCILDHVASNSGNNRPDQDTTNTYWTLLVAHDRNNSMTTYGDLETFENGVYTPVHIGSTSYVLRVNGNVPNWQQINVIPSVYYVDANSGIDIPTYGTSWDQPWKTIKYSLTQIGSGQYFPITSNLLVANKGWLITEMIQWMYYQMANSISPFSPTSLWDATYTQRDAGYIIDAIVYDMQRGGNSQIVAATLKFFYYGSTNQLVNSLVDSAIEYFPPSLSYLMYLMECVVSNIPPAQSYQTLNGISGSSYVNQYFTGSGSGSAVSETTAPTEVASLMSILITALTNVSTSQIPPSNTGLTAILNVKTGTYNESLPLTVYENISVVGDELRSTTVQPAVSLEFYCTETIGGPNTVIVNSTVGLTDQMPMQFISPYVNNASTTFGGVTSGQTYYIIGSSITSNSFQIQSSPNFTFVGSTTSGSNIISNVSKITNMVVGMTVTGTGIPAGTTVVSFTQAINSIATVTLSANATESSTFVTFSAIGQTVTLTTGSGSMLCYAGDCLKDMWYMRNGTTMRNMTFTGLLGTLTAQDAYGLARPTGGKYTSLDPGNGPDDTSVWIIRRSPYMQNITNFGTGCVGTKIDGTLHNGGSKSMLHNDYTQVLSDGIGVYCTGSGSITECVSVFSYYNYIGHFAENGGRIRSTNGNSSYGTYGAVSEGYDPNETPVSGTIFNQSTQVQASVQSAFGTTAQLLKLTYSNAGSAYYNPTTNMLQYSNNFISSPWNSDGNVTFIKNETAPTGYTEAWLLTGTKSVAGQGYIYQNVSINPAGAVYTGLTGTTQSGSGSGAVFTVYVTSTQYAVSVTSPGSLYAVTNTILISGNQLGGIAGTNDLLITVSSLTGSGILGITTSGTVPAGSAQNYILSAYVYAGTATTLDFQGIFSGTATLTSGITYNVSTNICTPYSSGTYTPITGTTLSAFTPTAYGAKKTLVSGWYRVWMAVNDTTGTNSTLQFRIYPSGASSPIANTYSILYGAQVEDSSSTSGPNFYLETQATNYTAYANYEVVGAGSGAVLLGNETRSESVFNTRIITDSSSYTGGSGYVTASNSATGGTATQITLATTEQGLNNYVGMRIFINSGTGAGQYGYIATYNNSTKVAQVLQEEFDSLSIVSTSSSGNALTIASGSDLSKLYLNQLVQFTPTFYTTTISETSIKSMLVTAAYGGTANVLVVATTAPLAVNMPVTFSGTTFSTLTTGYTYYISSVDNSSATFTGTISGTVLTISSVAGTVEIGQLLTGGTVSAGTYITGGSGLVWSVNNSQTATATGSQSTLIQITSSLYGAVWQLSTASGSMSMNYPDYYGYLTASSTSNMLVNIPISFTGSALGGLNLGTTYYINDIIDSSNFTISSLQVTATATTTTSSNNTIQVSSTSSLIPLNPVVFGGTILDANITSGTKYYISNIVDSGDFQIASSIINVTISSTAVTTNYIVASSTTGFVANQPIKFSGLPFGGLVAEQIYYIQTILPDGVSFIVSSTITGGVAGSAVALTSATGLMMARTCPAPVTLAGGSGSTSITSTGNRIIVTNTSGSMNATFSTALIGGVSGTTQYYITSISGNNITVSTTQGGTSLTLTNATGNMQMGAVGWDHINPGTPIVSTLDSTSAYYIEPRTIFSEPSYSQTSASSVITLQSGVTWQAIIYGQNTFMAIPSQGSTGGTSVDGSTWTNMILPSPSTGNYNWTGLAYGNNYWIACATGVGVIAYSNSAGAGWRTATLPSTTTWSQVAYGNGVFVTIATGTTSAAYSTNYGATWTSSTLPSSQTWVSLTYGGGVFLAISSSGVGAWSYNGASWQATSLPTSVGTLSSVVISGTGGTFTCSTSSFSLVVGQAITISGTNGGSGSVTNGTYYIIATNGLTTFTLSSTVGGSAITTTAGTPSGLTFTVGGNTAYTSVQYGNGRFVAIQSSTGVYAVYSFNGIQWYNSKTYVSGTLMQYGQGAFVTLTANSTASYKSDSGLWWKSRTVTNQNYTAIGFGFNSSNVGVFSTLAGANPYYGTYIVCGAKAQGRASVTSGVLTSVNLWEPGSGYTSTPTVSFVDYNISIVALGSPRVGNGALANPTFINRGTGYVTSSTVITLTGNGYADTYQTGYTIIINNLTSVPAVGSNLTISGNSQIYKVTSATAVYGTVAPYIEANVQISPSMTNALSPATGTAVSIRQLYSQCRLTNHDFLDIGTGNSIQTNYPNVDATTVKPNNEVVEANQGRVFYTSTDQDGNFEVGGLFGVQQATGTVTLSATQFGLQGLSTLSLGGIAVGSSSVVINQFSTDPTFTANSDQIIPTQRAIKSYLQSRLSQGGSNTFTGELIAGTTVVGGTNFITSSLPQGTTGSTTKMANKVYFDAYGVAGEMAAWEFFARNAWHKTTMF